MPRTPRQSPRLGVTAMSKSASSRPIIAAKGVPTGASGSSSMIPSCSSLKPISRSEQSIPQLSTPLIFAFLRTTPVPGMVVPTGAKTPFMPVRALGAPHTTSTRSAPVSTTQSLSLSAFGCGFASTTWATVKGASVVAGVAERFHLEADRGEFRRERVHACIGLQMRLQPGEGELHALKPAARLGTSKGAKP